MNKSKVIHLAAYSLSFLLIVFVLFRLFALGADLGLQQAEVRQPSGKLGNLLKLDVNKLSSVQVKSKMGNIFLLNVQEIIENWEKKGYKVHLNREITQALDDVTVTNHNVKWRLLEPSVAKVDVNVIERLLDTLDNLPFYSVSVSNGEAELEKYGLKQPKAIIKCVFNNRQEIEMQVGLASFEDNDRYYFRFKNSTVVFTVGPEIKNFLLPKLSFVSRKIGSTVNVFLPEYFSFARHSDSFYFDALLTTPYSTWPEHDCEKKEHLDRPLKRWYSYRPFYNLLNQTVAHEIVSRFQTLEAYDCIDEVDANSVMSTSQMEKYGFYKPSFLVKVGTLNGEKWQIIVGKQVGDYYYVKTSTSPYIYLVEQKAFMTLRLPNYLFFRAKPFAFSLSNLQSLECKQADYSMKLELTDFNGTDASVADKAESSVLQTLPDYPKLRDLSVAPNLPAASKQYVLEDYQKRIYAEELDKSLLGVKLPDNYNVTWLDLKTDKVNKKVNKIAVSGEAARQLDSLWQALFQHIQSVQASDLAWQTIFLDKTSEPVYEFKFKFNSGEKLNFALYEANYNSYYLFINENFSHYVIHRDLLLGSAKTNYLDTILQTLYKLMTE